MGNDQCKRDAVQLKTDLYSANNTLEELKRNSLKLDNLTLTHDITKKQVQSFMFSKSVPFPLIIHERDTARNRNKNIPINVNELLVPLFESNGKSLCYVNDSFEKCQETTSGKHLLFLPTHAIKEDPSSSNINGYSGKIRVFDLTVKKQDTCLSVSDEKWTITKCDTADLFSIKM